MRERVRLIRRTVNAPLRIPAGSEGWVQRYDTGTGKEMLAFVRWDDGDRSWHPVGALEFLERDHRRAA